MASMEWGTGRQIQYALAALVALTLVGIGGYFGFVYKAPSCMDGLKNGREEGIDCGGICQALCTGPLVSVIWARSVMVAPGVYHAVALIKNPDTAAAGEVPYTVSLFDEKNILVATRAGRIALEPGAVVPLFEANIQTGNRAPARTFVDIGAGEWRRGVRTALPLSVIPVTSADAVNQSRVLTANLVSDTAVPVGPVTVTALLYDASSTLVAASQTKVETLNARESRTLTFTWQEPFMPPVATYDLLPTLR